MRRLHRVLHQASQLTRVVVGVGTRYAPSPVPLMDVGPQSPPRADRCHAMVWTLYVCADDGEIDATDATDATDAINVTCADAPSLAPHVARAIDDAIDALHLTLKADADPRGPFDPVSAAARLHAALCRASSLYDVRLRCGSRELTGADVKDFHAAHDRVVDLVTRARIAEVGRDFQVDVSPRASSRHGWGPHVGHYLRRVSEGTA